MEQGRCRQKATLCKRLIKRILAIRTAGYPPLNPATLTSIDTLAQNKGSMSVSDKQLVAALKAVADPARLKILRLLKQKGQCSIGKGVGMCACDVQDHIDLSQPTISHHMSILRKAGLVAGEKHGLWMWYKRDEKALKDLAQSLNAEL